MKFTITVEMQDRWVPHFLGMLARMEKLGKIGSSRKVTFYSDGDGDFRPRFSWDADVTPVEPRRVNDRGDAFFDAG